jgi:hypothetical protein
VREVLRAPRPPTEVFNLEVIGTQQYFVGDVGVLAHNAYYRGAKPGQSPSFVPRPIDIEVNRTTGFVRSDRGLSLDKNAEALAERGFEAHEVNLRTVPDSLHIVQQGSRPSHFVIAPRPGVNLTPEQFIEACRGIRCL